MKIKYKIVGEREIPDISFNGIAGIAKQITYSKSKKICVIEWTYKIEVSVFSWTGKYWKLKE